VDTQCTFPSSHQVDIFSVATQWTFCQWPRSGYYASVHPVEILPVAFQWTYFQWSHSEHLPVYHPVDIFLVVTQWTSCQWPPSGHFASGRSLNILPSGHYSSDSSVSILPVATHFTFRQWTPGKSGENTGCPPRANHQWTPVGTQWSGFRLQ
jgi:hypothetical protein